MIGYVSRKWVGNGNYGPFSVPWVFTGEASGWSNTQTLTIPASGSSSNKLPSPASTSNQTTEPTTNEPAQTLQLEAVIGTIIAIVVVSSVLLFYFKKRKHLSVPSSTISNNNNHY